MGLPQKIGKFASAIDAFRAQFSKVWNQPVLPVEEWSVSKEVTDADPKGHT